MQLRPRYGTDPIIVFEGSPTAIIEPCIRQQARLTEALQGLNDEQWHHASRCEGWSARDVVLHLATANSFWAISIQAGLRGEPTQFLATFDPVVSPAQHVAQAGDASAAEALDQFVASSASLVQTLESLTDTEMNMLAESPPGHVSVNAVAHHALWDSWIHERDILHPLGIATAAEADEVASCLRYVAALGPAFAVNDEPELVAELMVTATDPDTSFLVDVARRVTIRDIGSDTQLRLTGDAINLVEGLSYRAPLDTPLPDNLARLVGGLGEVFEAEAH